MKFKKSEIVKRCHHVALEVGDMDKAIDFYRNFLGMRLTERHPAGENENVPVELAFLRLHEQHHDMVLTFDPQRRLTDRKKDAGPPGIHHFAFECPHRQSFLKYLEQADDMNLDIVRGPVAHTSVDRGGDGTWGENESFYVLDPDGHRIEIFCNLANINEDGDYIDTNGLRVEGYSASEI